MESKESFQCSFMDTLPVNELSPHPKNRNQHPPEQITRLAKLIDYQGQRHPVIVSNLSGHIVVGHGRLEAIKQLGWERVAVDYQDFDSEEQEYLFMQSDNAIAEWAELDLAGINADLGDIGPFDIELLGIEDFSVEPIDKLDPKSDEDEVPEVKETVVKRGDIWILGNHRLMCGDSTMIDDVEKLMNRQKADMVLTDPPYGISFKANYSTDGGIKTGRKNLVKHEYEVIKGDDSELDIGKVISVFDYCKEVFIWGAQCFARFLPHSTWICWDRKLNESADKNLCGSFDLCWSKNRHKMDMYRIPWYGVFGHNKKDDGATKVHPTMKPVKLFAQMIEDFSKEGSNIVDIFLGSGTTIIACEKTNRKCYGMELDEHYCAVIINRWQNYTGKDAVLESTGQTYKELVR